VCAAILLGATHDSALAFLTRRHAGREYAGAVAVAGACAVWLGLPTEVRWALPLHVLLRYCLGRR
jgi:hypothetical protein